ncbi:MAG: inositol monophosphatase [Elusimicrobia bacterium]|nr:inositol monophosphatase [Elusimicrobiota bacterium]
MLGAVNMEEIKTLKKALLEGGKILSKYFGRVTYELKGRANLLTEADLKTQQKVISVIKSAFPGHGFLAEEDGLPPSKLGGGPIWIIDPLDGTTNYAHGFPVSAVSIGFMAGGKMLAGGIYDPFRRELFLTCRGRGAFLNSKRMKVSGAAKLEDALLVTGFPYDRAEKSGFYCSFFSAFLNISHDVRRMGAASLDMAWLAAGRTDGYWEFGLKPWDVAAGRLIVEEAGGKVTDFNGKPWSGLGEYGARTLATNGRIHSEMLKLIRRQLKLIHS